MDARNPKGYLEILYKSSYGRVHPTYKRDRSFLIFEFKASDPKPTKPTDYNLLNKSGSK